MKLLPIALAAMMAAPVSAEYRGHTGAAFIQHPNGSVSVRNHPRVNFDRGEYSRDNGWTHPPYSHGGNRYEARTARSRDIINEAASRHQRQQMALAGVVIGGAVSGVVSGVIGGMSTHEHTRNPHFEAPPDETVYGNIQPVQIQSAPQIIYVPVSNNPYAHMPPMQPMQPTIIPEPDDGRAEYIKLCSGYGFSKATCLKVWLGEEPAPRMQFRAGDIQRKNEMPPLPEPQQPVRESVPLPEWKPIKPEVKDNPDEGKDIESVIVQNQQPDFTDEPEVPVTKDGLLNVDNEEYKLKRDEALKKPNSFVEHIIVR